MTEERPDSVTTQEVEHGECECHHSPRTLLYDEPQGWLGHPPVLLLPDPDDVREKLWWSSPRRIRTSVSPSASTSRLPPTVEGPHSADWSLRGLYTRLCKRKWRVRPHSADQVSESGVSGPSDCRYGTRHMSGGRGTRRVCVETETFRWSLDFCSLTKPFVVSFPEGSVETSASR